MLCAACVTLPVPPRLGAPTLPDAFVMDRNWYPSGKAGCVRTVNPIVRQGRLREAYIVDLSMQLFKLTWKMRLNVRRTKNMND